MFQLSKLYRIAALLVLTSASTAYGACEIFRVEAHSGNNSYYGSAIPLNLNGASILVTADHVLPFEVKIGDTVDVSLSNGTTTQATVLRRDWASDLMILSPVSPIHVSCGLASKLVNVGDNVSIVGFPGGDWSRVFRPGRVIETASSAVRVARPISVIKAVGLGEKGMSGGALMNRDGSIAGILLQDWVNPNHSEQTGLYALPATELSLQLVAMLAQPEMEMPSPFMIRRAVPEMSAYGFRFRPTHTDSISSRQMGKGGGHPDGIGATSSDDELEVVGLSGDSVSPAWIPMAKILRRVQSEGGSEMLVKQTSTGQSCSNLVELGRILLMNPGLPPDLSFYLNRTTPASHSSSTEDLDALSERIVILALSLAESSPSAIEPAQKIRALQGQWIKTHEIRTIQELVKTAQDASPAWSAAADSLSSNWKAVVEIQVLVLRINKALGQTTSTSQLDVQ
jgi:hypothetical protein